MLTVTSVVGNIFRDRTLQSRYKNMKTTVNYERLQISRLETERARLRRKTDRGTDIGLILKPGTRLQHGDVLLSSPEKFIVVEQLPEKIISIRIKNKKSRNLVQLCAMIGHIIGNRHRPIAVDDKGTISFPIMADSEVDLFRKLLDSIIDHIDLKLEERIFQPEEGMHVHEH